MIKQVHWAKPDAEPLERRKKLHRVRKAALGGGSCHPTPGSSTIDALSSCTSYLHFVGLLFFIFNLVGCS